MRVKPIGRIHIIHTLTKIYTGNTPILVRNEVNASGREKHSIQPGCLRDILFAFYNFAVTPDNWRIVKLHPCFVNADHVQYERLKQVFPVYQGEPRRGAVDIGRIALSSGSAENLGREQHPHRLGR